MALLPDLWKNYWSNWGTSVAKVGTALNLPEWNISERAGSAWQPVKPAYASEPAPQFQTYTGGNYLQSEPTRVNPPSGWTMPKTTPVGSGVSTGGEQPPTTNNQGYQGPSEQDIINQEYEAFSNYLGQQEAGAQKNYEAQIANLGGQKTTLETTAKTNLGNTVADIGTKQAEGRQQERLSLQKVRQLLMDLEQRNAARGAISGGGSVSEALAERFGRTAQQNVGGVMQEGQGLQNALETEKVKANQFYNQKISEIGDWYNQEKSSADATLQGNLSQIQAARTESAGAKARATLDAWKNYFNTVNQARLEAAQFKMQYDTWKQQIDYQIGNYKPNQYAQPDYTKYMQFLNPAGQVTNAFTGATNIFRINPYKQEEEPVGLVG